MKIYEKLLKKYNLTEEIIDAVGKFESELEEYREKKDAIRQRKHIEELRNKSESERTFDEKMTLFYIKSYEEDLIERMEKWNELEELLDKKKKVTVEFTRYTPPKSLE